jgi:hypothetical protein
MKIRVTMKNPDALHDAVEEAVKEELANADNLSEEEKEEIMEIRRNENIEKARKWFEYGEYLTVEIDTEADTCVVVQRRG